MMNDEAFSYKNSDGINNEGHSYEQKVAAFLALRLYSTQKDFKLLINVKGFGMWDDIVITTTDENHTTKLYCMQLKHVSGTCNSILKPVMLEKRGKNGKSLLDLSKLVQGYEIVKKIVSNDSEENPGLEPIFKRVENHNIFVIFFTNIKGFLYNNNRTLMANQLEFISTRNDVIYDDPSYSVVDIGHIIEDCGDEVQNSNFLNAFSYYGNQLGQKDMDKVIVKELASILKIPEEDTRILQNIYQQYLEYIMRWSLGKIQGYHSLTRKHLRLNLADFLSSQLKLTKQLQSYDQQLYKRHQFEDWNHIVDKKQLVVLQNLEQGQLDFVQQAISRRPEQFLTKTEILNVLNNGTIDFCELLSQLESKYDLRYYVNEDIQQEESCSPQDLVRLLWKLGKIPLLVRGRNQKDLDIIIKILDFLEEDNLTITVFLEAPLELKNRKYIIKSLEDIADDEVEAILKKEIFLHGKALTLRVMRENCSSIKKIALDNVLSILTEKVALGEQFKCSYSYIPRKIRGVVLNLEILNNNFDDVMVVFGKKVNMFWILNYQSLDFADIAHVYELDSADIQEEIVKYRIFLIPSDDYQQCFNIFEKLAKLQPSKTHHLVKRVSLQEEEALQWLVSKGSIENIKPWRLSKSKLQSLEITRVQTQVNILTGEAGYGKTAQMLYLAENQTDILVVFVRLGQFSKYISTNREGMSTEELLRSIFMETTKPTTPRCATDLFDAFFTSRIILLIFDGLDEISGKFKEAVLGFITDVIKLDIKVWVTCRTCVAEDVENALNTLSFELKPFTKRQQAKFVEQYFGKSSKNFKLIQETFQGKRELLSVPLFLYMFCESYKLDANTTGRLCELEVYEKFIKNEIGKFCNHITQDDPLVMQCVISKLSGFIETRAVCNIFPANLTKDFVNDADAFEKDSYSFVGRQFKSFGLIKKVSINEETQYVFTHKTLGDYLAAKVLSKTQHKTKLIKYIFKKQLSTLQRYFYKIMCKDQSNNSAFINSIIEEDSKAFNAYLAGWVFSKRDCTTPLHVAAFMGRRHYCSSFSTINFSSALRSSKSKALKFVTKMLDLPQYATFVDQKDKLLGWCPIDYADSRGALDIIEEFAKLPNFKVKSLRLAKKIPIIILLFFTIKFHYNNLFKHLVLQFTDFTAVCSVSRNTLLHVAAQYNNMHALNYLVKQIPVDSRNAKNETPLHLAVCSSFKNGVYQLLHKNAKLDIQNHEGYTPLHKAVELGSAKLVKKLVAAGADVHTITKDGDTLLHTAVAYNHANIAKILVRDCQLIADLQNNAKQTPLHVALLHDNFGCVKVLRERISNFNEADYFGMTPLFCAAQTGRMDAVKNMISSGAEVNVLNKWFYETPVSVAKSSKQDAIVGYLKPLLSYEFFLWDEDKDTDGYKETPAFAQVKKKLKNMNAVYEDYSFLYLWSMLGDTEEVEKIIHRYKKLKKTLLETNNNTGFSAIHIAAAFGRTEVIKTLINNGVPPSFPCKDSEDTPLHIAAARGFVSVVKLLLTHDVDVNYKNKLKITPIVLAFLNNQYNIVWLLRERGGNLENIDEIEGVASAYRKNILGSMKVCVKDLENEIRRLLSVQAQDPKNNGTGATNLVPVYKNLLQVLTKSK